MCNSVEIGAIVAYTPRELANVVGQDAIVWSDQNPFVRWPEGKEWRDPDLCLCSVNLPATLTKAGLRWKRSGVDPMEFVVSD
ncbi:hypothetical protein [Sinorhizobium meliloti]|uniref:hypothetical protein n=1 Tax=Rhizobium meliloti TaxID=382 RepID=UPI000302DD17|nr:hypothetical protein [Sinorhizobium meliloti]MCO5962350.1 hypothetical protein [Sinorhizobium meliloti]